MTSDAPRRYRFAAFRRAVVLNPSSAAAHCYLSHGLAFAGREQQGDRELRQVRECTWLRLRENKKLLCLLGYLRQFPRGWLGSYNQVPRTSHLALD